MDHVGKSEVQFLQSLHQLLCAYRKRLSVSSSAARKFCAFVEGVGQAFDLTDLSTIG